MSTEMYMACQSLLRTMGSSTAPEAMRATLTRPSVIISFRFRTLRTANQIPRAPMRPNMRNWAL